MKTALAALAGLLLVASPALAKEASTTLTVSGWHCAGCSNRTVGAIKAVKGVKDATADAATKTVTVTYDDEVTNVAALEKAVASLNYKVEKPAEAKAE